MTSPQPEIPERLMELYPKERQPIIDELVKRALCYLDTDGVVTGKEGIPQVRANIDGVVIWQNTNGSLLIKFDGVHKSMYDGSGRYIHTIFACDHLGECYNIHFNSIPDVIESLRQHQILDDLANV